MLTVLDFTSLYITVNFVYSPSLFLLCNLYPYMNLCAFTLIILVPKQIDFMRLFTSYKLWDCFLLC